MMAIINYRKGFLFTVFVASAALVMGQLHFAPVWTGNGVDHMNFYVVKASIEGSNMQAGDEIAVFDGVHCVGAEVLSEEMELNHAGCFCTIPMVNQKWRMALSTIHYSLSGDE